MVINISHNELMICIICTTVLINLFQYFCILPKVKYQKKETEENNFFKANLIVSILFSISIVFLILMFITGQWGNYMQFVIYVILLICLFIMGIRSCFFTGKELSENNFENKEKLLMIRRHYRIWGVIAIGVSIFLLIFLFISL